MAKARAIAPAAALAKARDALARDDEEAALEALLDAWRTTRAVAIASLIELLGDRLAQVLPTEFAGKADALHTMWMGVAVERRAVDLPRLIGSVILSPRSFGVAVVEALVARGRALAAWPADPRTGELVLRLLKEPGYESSSSSTFPFWRALLDLVLTHDDPRSLALLDRLDFGDVFGQFSDRSRARSWFQKEVDATVAELRRRHGKSAPALPAALAAPVKELARAIGLASRKPVSAAQRARLAREPVLPPAPRPKRRPRVAIDAASTTAQLATAATALEAGDKAAALVALLEAWRANRAPRIAALVEAVSARLETQLSPIDGKDRKAIHAAWLAIAKRRDAADLPRLLDSITHTFARSTDALARTQALASWPADPRTIAAVVRQLTSPPFHAGSSKPFWTALVALAVDHADPRAAALLEGIPFGKIFRWRYADNRATVRWFRKLATDAAEQLRGRVTAEPLLDEAATAGCARLEKLVAGDRGDLLLAAIAEHPADDHLRQVYADHLQEHGDPRGEYIALQLANRDPARMVKLRRAHAHAWVGPLLPHHIELPACSFERGFLDEVRLKRGEPSSLAPVIGHPVWATVRRLHLGGMTEVPMKLIRHPIMRSLETVGRTGQWFTVIRHANGTCTLDDAQPAKRE